MPTAAPTPVANLDPNRNGREGENDGASKSDEDEGAAMTGGEKAGMWTGIAIAAMLLIAALGVAYKRKKRRSDAMGWKNITVDQGVGRHRNSGIELNESGGASNPASGKRGRSDTDAPLNLNPAYAI